MGHYHRIVNLTERQVLTSFDAGEFDKLMEFGVGSGQTMAALWLLLGREAWLGDRIAILGYEGRPGDLAPHVVAETGLDGTAYYAENLRSTGELARSLLEQSGICSFTAEPLEHSTWWKAEHPAAVTAAGVDVVAVDFDQGQLLDPAQFGDSRDLVMSAVTGGWGGVTSGLAVVLAASNRGGGRGGGDFRGSGPVIGTWAGDRIGVVPAQTAKGMADISASVREVLAMSGVGAYSFEGGRVHREHPPWLAARAG